MKPIIHEILKARSKRDTARQHLMSHINCLGSDLVHEAKRMEKDPSYRPNALGIVQHLGREVDRLCSVLDERTEALEALISSEKE